MDAALTGSLQWSCSCFHLSVGVELFVCELVLHKENGRRSVLHFVSSLQCTFFHYRAVSLPRHRYTLTLFPLSVSLATLPFAYTLFFVCFCFMLLLWHYPQLLQQLCDTLFSSPTHLPTPYTRATRMSIRCQHNRSDINGRP
jgi:hypothetical protein